VAERYADRLRVGKAHLDRAFQALGDRLPFEIEAWDIGGGPMVYRNLKDGTKDVDLVVTMKRERDAIIAVLTTPSVGYVNEGFLSEYAGLDAVLLRKRGEVGIDVFVGRIMQKFHLTSSMKARADGPHKFAKLIVHHCSNEDIFLLKAITHRPDDDQDVLTLAGTGLDGNVLRMEAEAQRKIAGENWPWKIYHALGEIEKRTGVPLPMRAELVD
jgi:hypothetical protein